jgi:hypothetical protein
MINGEDSIKKDNLNRTAKTRQPERKNQSSRTGQADRTDLTGLP